MIALAIVLAVGAIGIMALALAGIYVIYSAGKYMRSDRDM